MRCYNKMRSLPERGSWTPEHLLSVWGTEMGFGPLGHPKRLNHLSAAISTFWENSPSSESVAENTGAPRLVEGSWLGKTSVLLPAGAQLLSGKESDEGRHTENTETSQIKCNYQKSISSLWPDAKFWFVELLRSNNDEDEEVGPETGLGVWCRCRIASTAVAPNRAVRHQPIRRRNDQRR